MLEAKKGRIKSSEDTKLSVRTNGLYNFKPNRRNELHRQRVEDSYSYFSNVPEVSINASDLPA